jgi:trehalose 2-sulfotransferase
LTGRGYLLCATPRTGSTLLCSLLASTGVLGRPESYFRLEDEAWYCERWGLATDRGQARDYRAFVRSARTAATTDNGVLGIRIMWESLDRPLAHLRQERDVSDVAVLRRGLGDLCFVWLRRLDVIGQAVSWSRADQTGYWHQGDTVSGEPTLDLERLRERHATIEAHNQEWADWFDRHGVAPLAVTYEELVGDRSAVVDRIAAQLGVTLPEGRQPASAHRRQADQLNAAWAAALRSDLESG